MDKPDTIAVNVEVERKVHACRADMYVDIKGDSFVSGKAALKKAREVRDLVAALAEVGIEERGIQVIGIRAEVSSGIIGKSSSAVYRLRIEVPSLEMLADSLGAVTTRKNAALTLLDWQYDRIGDLHDEMLGEALRKAQQRAELICGELYHRNLGVHSLAEKFKDDQEKPARLYAGGMLTDCSFREVRRKHAVTKEELGLEVSHAKTVSLDLRVEYRVQPQPTAEAPAAPDG